ncbi:hypothetical protein GCM10027418_05290 [Mariniluteicoccus endophyticus]
MDVDEVLALRLAAQGLTGPDFGSVTEAVQASLARQAQDAPLARWSLAQRVEGTPTDSQVLDALSTGEVVRTHVLRPTWHWVAAADLRWLIALTGPKIVSGNRTRHRQLGVDDQVRAASAQVLRRALAGAQLTRKELAPLLPTTDFPQQGQVVGHLLMLAEVEGVICSGAPRAGEHTYALVDDVVAESSGPEDPVAELVSRFVHGHGPTSVKDLTRWCNVAAGPLRKALDNGGFATATVDGVDLWWDAGLQTHGLEGEWLLPTFDEAYLSHDRPRFARLQGHRMDDRHFNAAEAGWGYVVVDGIDVGMFRRRATRTRATVELHLGTGIGRARRERALAAAERLGDFLERPTEVTVS